MRTVAMVLAGGRGSRVATEVNKVFLSVHDRVMLDYPLETFHLAEQVDEIVVVSRREDDERLRQLLGSRSGKPVRVVTGGASRHESEIAGIESLAGPIEAGEIELVAIHDGARPFMTLDLLEACINTARRLGGAIPGLPPESPLYRLTGNGALPLDESALIRAQTPQVFEAKALLGAY
ncbi:MAG: 2-C-methyl-D-erythritol 4-phosphate cytidylyltransferase, partial [Acidimicrobiia bacterium]